ncbi:MAG: DNA translocase FtsK [Endomicrobia bacterium]|nr:DNA translocase FtsK [Endomicrobiia bacterium]
MTHKVKYKNFYVRNHKINNKQKVWTIIVVVILSMFLLYCTIFPNRAGIFGIEINRFITKIFGITKFFIPISFLYWIWYILKSKEHKLKSYSLLILLLIILFAGITKSVLLLLNIKNVNYFSGWLGNMVFDTAEKLFGSIFGGIVILVLFFYVLTFLFEISLYDIFYSVYSKIIADINDWYTNFRDRNSKMSQKNRLSSRYLEQRQSVSNKEKKSEIDDLKIKEIIKQKKDIVVPPLNKRELTEETYNKKAKIEDEKKDTTNLAKEASKSEYKLPDISLLTKYQTVEAEENFIDEAQKLEKILAEFNINAKVVDISAGPVVAMYELQLEPGIKVQSINALRDNIALGLKTSSIRIVAPIPGKGTVGIEFPRKNPQIVSIREVLESQEYKTKFSKMKLPIVLGKTTDGKVYIDDIVPMPHILIAGSTGSGKSVCVHSLIVSLLYSCSPDYLKLVLIDPKRLELMHYNGIPHLYDPNCNPEDVKVITASKEAAKVLVSLVKVMEQRYEKFANFSVRNIEGYNALVKSRGEKVEPYIVVIIDEFADLILTSPKEVEDSIQRLAQMARAVGIHLVLATQRPSVDVITGVIKANFSCRIAFQVLSKTDSRVILDSIGAEELLGKGDMLYLPTGAPKPIRLQGAYVSEKDINNIVEFIRLQGVLPNYEPIVKGQTPAKILKEKESQQSEDLYAALVLIKERKRVSQDLLKAFFRSSAKATDILSLLEVKGYIYKPEGTNRWNINFDKVEEAINEYEKSKNLQKN